MPVWEAVLEREPLLIVCAECMYFTDDGGSYIYWRMAGDIIIGFLVVKDFVMC